MDQFPNEQHITYQLRYVQCADPSCRTCHLGPGHGPDWYAFWYNDAELYSLSIGPADSVSLAPPMESSASESTPEMESGGAIEEPPLEEGTSQE